MKIFISLLIGLFLFSLANTEIFAQQRHQKLTIILVRHAEKDMAGDETNPDPRLSTEGRQRAQNLIKAVEKYKPDAIFSSQFIRTISTAEPLARKNRMMIQFYNHRNLKELAEIVTSGRFKRILIVGHNTTTPAMANLLLGEDKYKPLDESEYDKIWVVKVKKKKRKPNRVKEKIITY